jgi:hypothetical protein
MSNFERMVPQERRSFQIVGTSLASLVGTTNTNIVAFANLFVSMFGITGYRPNSSSIAAVEGSGTYVNVVNDAQFGTTFKFVRRGVYRFEVAAPTEVQDAEPATYNLALTLDSAAANLLAAGTVLPTTVNVRNERGVFGWSAGSIGVLSAGVGGGAPTVNFGGEVYITDALAGGAVPAAAAGAQGTGVVRLHCNNNGGGVLGGNIITNQLLSLWCTQTNDLVGP